MYKIKEKGVDIGLSDMRNTKDIFWSSRGNSYVRVEPTERSRWIWENQEGERFLIISVNGIGEIRWSVSHGKNHNDEEKSVIEYFKALEVK